MGDPQLQVIPHIEDGNVAEAMRRLRMYEQLLWDELGIYPFAKITAVFESLSLDFSRDTGMRLPVFA